MKAPANASTARQVSERSGHETTFVHIVWSKGQSTGATSAPARLHSLEFDLTQTGNALPTQTTLGQGALSAPAGVTLSTSADVNAASISEKLPA